MNQWTALLLVLAAVVYLVLPWDLDFIPVVGRLDDVALLLLALANYWKKAGGDPARKSRPAPGGHGRSGGGPRGEGAAGGADPASVLGVDRAASEEEIKKAYRDLLGRYHPDRVQHLGEEFREMAAKRTVEINRAYQHIKRERGFS